MEVARCVRLFDKLCACVARCHCCTQVLKAKQGASQQYNSQAERDAHLKKHIKQLKQAATGQQDQLQSLQQQEQQLGNALNDLASVSAACAAHTACVDWQ